MAYNKHLEKTEEELRELRVVYERNDVDRFIDGLEAGDIKTEEDIINLTNTVRNNDGLALLEYSRLKRLKEEGFIENYATNYNKRYSTTHMLMNKMRSSISRGLSFLENFCEKKRRKGHSKKKRSVVRNSKLGNGEYRPSIWGLEHYKESVKILYKEVVGYTDDLTKCIELCIEMIEAVKHVKSHPEVADRIYDNCHRDTVINNRTTIKRFITLNANLENDILKKMQEWEKQKKEMKELKAELYHTMDVNEWNDLCICEEVMAARLNGVTNKERALWGENTHQIMRVRVAYDHLDELEPEGQKGRIGGKFLYRLLVWSHVLPNRGIEYWHEYFYERYTTKGTHNPDKPSAIKMAKGKIAKMNLQDDKKEQEEFNRKLDELVKMYMINEQDKLQALKEVVNF
jgi:hypothetical protein